MRGGSRTNAKVQVRMFGEFSITVNGNTLTHLKGTTKRVWMLIQYLLAHRFQTVPIETIVNDLWKFKPCGDPKNALKNLVYRARMLLKDLSGSRLYEFILFENGTYRWNNRYSCEMDSEQFMEYCRRGSDLSRDDQERLESYKQAIRLYTGMFLQKSASANWAVLMAAQYAKVYQECVEKCCGILFGLRRFQQAAEICRAALKYLPYELSLHRLLLQSYVKAGMRSEAFQHYRYVKDLFYREFCIDVSSSLLPFYRQLISGGTHIETDLNAIKKDLKEDAADGAYLCDYDVFRMVYRIQARVVARMGYSVFLALFSLISPEGTAFGSRYLCTVSEKLRDVILHSLRKTDVVVPYSSVQYIAMLPFTNFEDAQGVVNRISKKFRFACRNSKLKLVVNLSPLD